MPVEAASRVLAWLRLVTNLREVGISLQAPIVSVTIAHLT